MHRQSGTAEWAPQENNERKRVGAKAGPLIYYIFTKEGRDRYGYTSPIWMKYTMSIEEAAQYFRIGENKLRKMVRENRDADFVLWNGSRPQIKRKSFEKYIDAVCAV